MNAREFAKLVQYAENVTFDDSFGDLSYNAAEKIHEANKNGGSKNHAPVLSGHEAAALIKYQAMCLNGNWDPSGLEEVKCFMNRVVLYDMETVQAVITKRATKRHTMNVDGMEVTVNDNRFANVEA